MEPPDTAKAKAVTGEHHVPGCFVSYPMLESMISKLIIIQFRYCRCHQDLLLAAIEVPSRFHA